jgi:hypothetical protein
MKERIESFASELYVICMDALKSSDSEIRFGGLKLVGCLMTSVPSIFSDSSRLLQTQIHLESISNIDNSAQCRELAEKLLQIVFSPPTKASIISLDE